MDPRSVGFPLETDIWSLLLLIGVSHIHPETKGQKHRRSDCRRGSHEYDKPQSVGAGIIRRVCSLCSAVTIDLTNVDELTTPVVSPQSNIIAMTARHSESI